MNALVRLKCITKYSVRLLRSSRQCSNTTSKAQYRYDVKPFGQLSVRTGTSCDVNVQSIDAQLYPDQTVAYLDDGKGNRCLSALKVLYSEKKLVINEDAETRNPDKLSDGSRSCAVYIPVRFNVDVQVKGERNVYIQDMHSDSVEARLEHGTCLLNKLHCGSVVVESKGGDIISEGILQGNATLETQASGTIRLHKPLCQHLSVKTCDGDIHVKSLYADISTFSTHAASVYIGSAHRDVNIDIAERGNIQLDSLDGNLSATVKSGNVSLYVSRHNGINIFIQKGNVVLKLSDSLRTKVELAASGISFDDKLDISGLKTTKDHALAMMKGALRGRDDDYVDVEPVSDTTENKSEIKIKTLDGLIEVVQQDWYSTVKLSKYVSLETETKSC